MIDDHLEVRIFSEGLIVHKILDHVKVVNLHALLFIVHHIFWIVLEVRLELDLEGFHQLIVSTVLHRVAELQESETFEENTFKVKC